MTSNESLKDRLIQTAMDLFAQKSYNEVTVDEIIRAAGTSKGGFYYYFKSKEELLLYWLPHMEELYVNWYENSDRSLPADQQLVNFCRYSLRTTECETSPAMLSEIYSAQLKISHKERLIHVQRNLYVILADIARIGQERGELSSEDSYKTISRILVTAIRGSMYEWCLSNGASSLEESGIKIIKHLVSSFKPKSSVFPHL